MSMYRKGDGTPVPSTPPVVPHPVSDLTSFTEQTLAPTPPPVTYDFDQLNTLRQTIFNGGEISIEEMSIVVNTYALERSKALKASTKAEKAPSSRKKKVLPDLSDLLTIGT